ncbi:hypothetical protein [Paraglaciecola aquimarina]
MGTPNMLFDTDLHSSTGIHAAPINELYHKAHPEVDADELESLRS